MSTGLNPSGLGRSETFGPLKSESHTTEGINNDYRVQADDTVSDINAELQGGGVHVHFPVLSSPITFDQRFVLYPNTKVTAYGFAKHLTLADGADDYGFSNNERNEANAADSNILIEGLNVDGNKDGQTASAPQDEMGNRGFFDFRNTKNLTIRDCVVLDPWSTGLNFTYSEDTLIENNWIERSADDGIGANINTANTVIRDNYVIDAGAGKTSGGPKGIEVQDEAQYVEVTGNTVKNATAEAIQLSAHSGFFDNVTDVTVSENTVVGAGDHGIEVTEGDGTFGRLEIIDNRVRNGASTGIFVDHAAEDLRVGGNTVSANDGPGIRLTSSVVDFLVTENTVVGNAVTTGHGIRIEGPGGSVSDNHVADGATGNGIYVSGKKVTIADNVTEGNAVSGIRYSIGADEVAGGSITGNESYGNSGRGIYVVDNKLTPILGNTVAENGAAGIETFTDTELISIGWNTAFDNAASGIQSGGTSALIGFNTAMNTAAGSTQPAGIYVADGDAWVDFNRSSGHADDFLGMQRAIWNRETTESASAEEPQGSYPPGVFVRFTDSGDGSGTGTYLIDRDGNPIQISSSA